MAQQQAVDFEIDIDNTNVKPFGGEGGFAPEIPPGEYVFDCVDIIQDTSKNNNSMLVMTFEVVEGEFASKQVKGWYTLTDKAMGRIAKLQIACGARLDKIRTSEIRGARFRATVIHQEGEQRNRPDGTPYPITMFAKVVNERPLEEAAPEPAAPPPVTRGAAKGSGAVRRT